jgi:hypothetical protein
LRGEGTKVVAVWVFWELAGGICRPLPDLR